MLTQVPLSRQPRNTELKVAWNPRRTALESLVKKMSIWLDDEVTADGKVVPEADNSWGEFVEVPS